MQTNLESYISYWSEGEIYSKGTKLNNKKEGICEYYYLNGNLCEKGLYINDNLEGYWVTYWSDGILKSSGHYLNNRKIGLWKIYIPLTSNPVSKRFYIR